MNSYIIARVGNNNYKIDLTGEEKVSYNFLISDIKDISKKKTSYSKTITVPGTKNNNDVFNNIFEITSDAYLFNPNKSVSCQFVVDGIPVITGYLKLNKIQFDNISKAIKYDIVIYSGNFDLVNILGDKKLSDLNLSGWNHTINATTVFDSWSGNTPYVYPIADYADWYTLSNINMANPPDDYLEYMNLNPWLKVSSLFYKIYQEAGFSINSEFLTGELFNSLIMSTSSKLKYSNDELKYKNWKATVGSASTYNLITTPTPNSNSTITLSLPDDVQEGFDFGELYYPGSGLFFPATDNEVRFINVILSFKDTGFGSTGLAGLPYQFTLQLYKNSSVVWQSSANWVNANNLLFDFTIPKICGLATDSFQLVLKVYTSQYINTIGAPSLILDNVSSVYCYVDDYFVQGDEVNISSLLDNNIKCIDFVSSILKTFNLYTEPLSSDPSTYIIEPRNQFYLGGRIYDWTNKLDSSKDIQQTLLSELQSRKFNFTFKQDDDYFNKKYYEVNNNNVYGSLQLEVDNDFLDIKSETKIEPLFTPFVERVIPGSSLISTPVLWDYDNGQIKFREKIQPKLAVFKVLNCERYILGTKRISSILTEPWYIMNSYCYAGSIYPSVQQPEFNLNFNTPVSTQYLTSAYTSSGLFYPERNLYTEYWEDFIDEITDKNNRLITCYMYLTPADITNLSFRNSIRLKINGNTSYFKLNSIRDYNPLTNEPCKVELIKSENAVPAPKIYRRQIRLLDIDNETARINIGRNSYVSPFSLSVGNSNSVEQSNSVAFGNSNSAKGYSSLAIGNYNTANTYSFAIGGSGNTSIGKFSGIVGGTDNSIENRYEGLYDRNIIIGGSNNIIRHTNTNNVIIGSNNSEVRTTGITNSVIIGSNNSYLQNDATNAVILGGENILAVSANTTYLQRGVVTEFERLELAADSARMVTTDKYGYLQPLMLSGTNGISLINSGGSLIWSYTGSTAPAINEYWTGSSGYQSLKRNNLASNNLTGEYSIIAAGKNSYTSADNTGILAGEFNTIYSKNSSILGGKRNIVQILSTYSSVVGGSGNSVSGNYSSILAGQNNFVNHNASSILAGRNLNSISADTAHASNLFILNSVRISGLTGIGNRMVVADASGNLSTQTIPTGGSGSTGSNIDLSAGTNVSITTAGTGTIIYTINSAQRYISGGTGTGSLISIAPAPTSYAGGAYSIAIGQNNSAQTANSIVIGGIGNSAYGAYSLKSTIVGGSGNKIRTDNSSATHNGILSSYNSIISGNTLRSTIVGGINNVINSSQFTTLLGGLSNNVQPNAYGYTSHNTIMGGVQNKIYGSHNLIRGNSSVVSGTSNVILNGNQMQIVADSTTILNGNYNRDYSIYGFNLIGHGKENHHQPGSMYSTILHGHYNHNYSMFGTIVNGKHNYMFGIAFGESELKTSHSTIINGYRNTTRGVYQTIANGKYNCLTSGATGSTIISLNYFTGTSANTLFTDSIQARSLTGSTNSIVKSSVNGLLYTQPEYIFYLTSAFTNSSSASTNMNWNITLNQGDVYKIDGSIIARCSSTGGVRFSVSGNVTPALTTIGHAGSIAAAPALRVLVTTGNSLNYITVANTNASINIHGTISAITNTTVYFGFNSNTNGQTTTVQIGSSLIAKKIS